MRGTGRPFPPPPISGTDEGGCPETSLIDWIIEVYQELVPDAAFIHIRPGEITAKGEGKN